MLIGISTDFGPEDRLPNRWTSFAQELSNAARTIPQGEFSTPPPARATGIFSSGSTIPIPMEWRKVTPITGLFNQAYGRFLLEANNVFALVFPPRAAVLSHVMADLEFFEIPSPYSRHRPTLN